MTPKKVLVLSGGGGRGAYLAGALEGLITGSSWRPDIVAGTSIGALTACAFASGYDATRPAAEWMPARVAALQHLWRKLRSEGVQQVPPDLPPVSRFVAGTLLGALTTSQRYTPGEESPVLGAGDEGTGGFVQNTIEWLLEKLARSGYPMPSLLDTAPWPHTLERDGWLDETRLNDPGAPMVLVTATDLRRGTLKVWQNHDGNGNPCDHLTVQQVMASSSVPSMYPPTPIAGRLYWDGCALANTPLDPVLDVLNGAPADIVVVLYHPYVADNEAGEVYEPPTTLIDALTPTVDLFMLASFRVALKRLAPGQEVTIIAPRDPAAIELLDLRRVFDYEPQVHEQLFYHGEHDARLAFNGA